ncbi:Clp protease N-terminal domain-containing protein [Streptomyces roseicoloratus]|uniref:Clp protease N-terminal domain-containing protein n=1 Tax=Streptomyces roseicoloratus TaxID=2508722 RepID=A0ABY9RSX6_9ACTN|nr:Clp protease N-terminal domain-containing protein [Streptomyces roseicoloratus]WMX44788.1 Clp protease N-terminal domain-containing protein [Streptomyces roseicoloratus]
MFERFTAAARSAVVAAQSEAVRAGSGVVAEEHLLLALLEQGALDTLGVDRAAVRSGLAEARRRGGLSKADQEALAGLGIDLTEVVARIEETHGEGALSATTPGGRGRTGGLFGRREPGRRTHRPFTTESKRVLENSLRIALGRKDKEIGARHLVLALLTGAGPVSEVLADHGVTYERAERDLTG